MEDRNATQGIMSWRAMTAQRTMHAATGQHPMPNAWTFARQSVKDRGNVWALTASNVPEPGGQYPSLNSSMGLVAHLDIT